MVTVCLALTAVKSIEPKTKILRPKDTEASLPYIIFDKKAKHSHIYSRSVVQQSGFLSGGGRDCF